MVPSFAVLVLVAWTVTVAGQRTVMELYGSGSTLCTLEMTQLCYGMSSTAKPPVYSAYRAIGTSSGRDEFIMGLTNLTTRPAYTMLGMPLPADNFIAAQAAGGIITVPTMVAKIGFFHSVRTANGSAQVLNLTSCILAQIFSHSISQWTHPAIKALNPNLVLAAGTPITVLRRQSLFSPSQQAVVSFFWSKCSSDNGGPWSWGNMASAVPWDPSTLPMSEDEDMLAALSTPWAQGGYRPNAIGFLDTALGLLPQYSLMEVAVQWTAGAPFTTAGQVGAGQPDQQANLLNTTSWPALDADWSTFSLTPVIQANPSLWPVLVTPLFIALKNATWLGAPGGLLMGALTMLLSNPMQVSIAANGHIPLLQGVRSSLITQAAALVQLDPSAPQWMFERDQAVMKGTGALDYVFSEFRVSGLTLAVENNDAAKGNIAMINTQLVQVWSNLSIAQTVRSQLQEALSNNAENQRLITKATQIATAGVVLSVLLAFVALVLAAVHVCKLKQVDAKYAKYISLGKFTMAKPAAQDDGF